MKQSPALTLLFAWLLPGAGHWYIGQRTKAVLFCFILIAMFVLGVLLTEGGCVDIRPRGAVKAALRIAVLDFRGAGEIDAGRHPWAFALQACNGAAAFAALLLSADRPEFPASKLGDLGLLLTLVAGALNVLLMADAFYRCGCTAGETEEKK